MSLTIPITTITDRYLNDCLRLADASDLTESFIPTLQARIKALVAEVRRTREVPSS